MSCNQAVAVLVQQSAIHSDFVYVVFALPTTGLGNDFLAHDMGTETATCTTL